MSESHNITENSASNTHYSLQDIIDISEQNSDWITALIEEDIITYDVNSDSHDDAEFNTEEVNKGEENSHFSHKQLNQALRATRISRDFDSSVSATGLIISLLDELEELRQFRHEHQKQRSAISPQVIDVKISDD